MNPVPIMKLVEIIKTIHTSKNTTDTIMNIVKTNKKKFLLSVMIILDLLQIEY